MGGRGRSHSPEQRQQVLELIDEAVQNGARQDEASKVVGLSSRTLQRWRKDPDGVDARQGPKTKPDHALTDEERQRIVQVANSPEYCDLSPHQIVARLADKRIYLCSESSFYRVLRQEEMNRHRQSQIASCCVFPRLSKLEYPS